MQDVLEYHEAGRPSCRRLRASSPAGLARSGPFLSTGCFWGRGVLEVGLNGATQIGLTLTL